jgi:MoaA/NifB/PqqE/SkfB family radical SAM enzyme
MGGFRAASFALGGGDPVDNKGLVTAVLRRRAWFFGNLDARKLLNLASAALSFVRKRETVAATPAIVKIDISPLCNLRCTVCIHADPNGNPALEKQVFEPKHRMSVEQFQRIIDRLAGRTTAVSLYYLGDPLVHPDLDRMCRIAADAGIQTHVSTNFSFGLKDERIRSLVESGLSHLTVCIDGLTQEKYQRTRVGGNIARVIRNLERVVQVRRELGRRHPLIEVQYILFQHNLDEVERARALCADLGVEQFSTFWGDLHNWTDRDPDRYEVLGPRPKGVIARCSWPYFSTVIKYDGTVIPCCTHRQGTQYAPGADARSFGNVFEEELSTIWNSSPYRQARRLASDPTRSRSEPELAKHFCDACPVLFETTRNERALWGNAVAFEAVYELDEKGRPVRRSAAEAARPARGDARAGPRAGG